MSTIEELKTLREREDHVEFKEAKHNYPFAGGKRTDPSERRHCVLGYIVAMANERGGRLVLGMADAYPHNVVGTDFAENEIGNLEDEIYTRLRIRVHAEELYEDSGKNKLRVLVINIPSRPLGKALRFEGVPLMRVGESLREMDDAEYLSIISEQDPDFSAKICKGLTLEDLDDNAVSEMRKLIAERSRHTALATLPLEQLLSDLSLLNEEGITYAALLLLGKENVIAKHMPQHNVVVEYRSSHDMVRYTARKEFREPLFLCIKSVWDYLNQPASNPLIHVMDMPRIIDVPSFNEETIREGILNSFMHRSLQMNGDILIKQYPDSIEITNPGGFPFGVNQGNILTVNSSPRSRLMAEVIEKTGLIERSGQGVDIMFSNCIAEGRSVPDYSRSDDFQVSLVIKSQIEDPLFYLFMQDLLNKVKTVDVFTLVNLYNIKRHHLSNLFEQRIPDMLEKGYICQHPYYKYVLGEGYFEQMMPVKKNLCSSKHLAMVYYCIEENNNSVAMSQFAERLSDVFTLKQTRLLIDKLVNCGFLGVSGVGKSTRYSLIGK